MYCPTDTPYDAPRQPECEICALEGCDLSAHEPEPECMLDDHGHETDEPAISWEDF